MAYNLVIQAGSTFAQVFRWEDSTVEFRDISAISTTAPARLTLSAEHGITDGWRVAVVGAKGLTALNASNSPPKSKDFFPVRVVDPTTLVLPGVNTKNLGAYVAGTGVIQFASSVDMTGYTARMQIRLAVDSPGDPLAELSTTNGGVTVDPVAQTVTVNIPALTTTAYTWTSGVYSLEMTSAGGQVTQLLSGTVTVLPEVTRG